jgi:hypothetical protein
MMKNNYFKSLLFAAVWLLTSLTASAQFTAKVEQTPRSDWGFVPATFAINEVAEALGTTVSHNDGVSFGSQFQQLDNKFVGVIANAEEGKICGPVQGAIGTYVFKVTGRDTGSFYTEDDAKNYQNQKNQYTSQMILPVMMDLADVKDNRARFY